MSIIYDALKKVENSGGLANVSDDRKSVKIVKINYVFYILVLLSSIVVANIIFGLISKPSPKVRLAQSEEKPLTSLPAARNDMPIAETYVPPITESPQKQKLVLSGVFFSQTDAYAIINDQVIKEGDTINGVAVKRIRQEGVELESAGVTFNLSSVK